MRFGIGCVRLVHKISCRSPAAARQFRRGFFSMELGKEQPVKSFVYNNTTYNNFSIDLKKEGGLRYAFRTKQFPSYKHRVLRTPLEINKATLACERVRDAIQRKVDSKTLSQANAEREAERIIELMSHKFDMKSVRTLVYPAKKILQLLYPDGIFVNDGAIEQIKATCVQNPVIFAPSHRTYMDFILLQFLCYHYEIPMPAIASAQDFLQMHFMSEMLRRCGAYFIRRSFNDDELYKSIFTKYVQNQLINGDSTMEAFVEGTRSRTGKSLHPKYGFLSTILEPFLSGRVFDVTIVPVNLTYDRLLEENLYAYEMLGFSKPPESTGALFKAYSILGTNYGRIYVTFGSPISVRDFVNKFPVYIDRSVHVIPASDYFTMTEGEQMAIRCLAHKIIKQQEKCAVNDIWPLACLEMGRQLAYTPSLQNDKSPEIDFFSLTQNVNKLLNFAQRLGHSVSSTVSMVESSSQQTSLSDALKEYFDFHDNFVTYRPERSIIQIHRPPVNTSGSTIRFFEHQRGNIFNLAQNYEHVDLIIPRLLLTQHANRCLHLFAPISYLAASFRLKADSRIDVLPIDVLKRNFHFLQKLFAREFVYDLLGEENGNFEAALQMALNAGTFKISGGTAKDHEEDSGKTKKKNASPFVEINNPEDVLSLKHMLEPFLINYYICADFFTQYEREILERDFLKLVQEGALTRLIRNSDDASSHVDSSYVDTRIPTAPDPDVHVTPKWFQILSTDTSKNCLNSLVDLGAVAKVKSAANFEKRSMSSDHGTVVSTVSGQQSFFVGFRNKKLADIKKTLNELMANFYETPSSVLLTEPLTQKGQQKQQEKTEKVDSAEEKIRIRSKL